MDTCRISRHHHHLYTYIYIYISRIRVSSFAQMQAHIYVLSPVLVLAFLVIFVWEERQFSFESTQRTIATFCVFIRGCLWSLPALAFVLLLFGVPNNDILKVSAIQIKARAVCFSEFTCALHYILLQ